MTNEQLSKNIKIKEQIDLNNNLIEQALSPNLWTLNNTVANLLKENERLQDECTHQYEEGFCVFCYKSEEN